MKKSIGAVKFLLVGGLILVLAAIANADVYKWVDKDGKVQYSDQPPLSGDAKKMRRNSKDMALTPSSNPPASTSAKPATPVADQELEYRKRKAEKEEAEKKQLVAAETAKKNKEYCNNLKGDLQSHSDGTRLVRYNEKGARLMLDDKERADSKRNLEESIANDCK